MTVVSPRIAGLKTSPSEVDRFWSEAAAVGGPLIEPWDESSVLVTFLWRGAAAQTSTGLGVDVTLARLPGTDLWHGSQVLPADLLTTYCLRHDVPAGFPTDESGTGALHLDPLNPRRLFFPADPLDPDDHDSWASVLELPWAPPALWARPVPGVTPGTITEHRVRSDTLGYELAVSVYRPAGVPADDLPVLLFFDGHLMRTVLRVPTTLDNLIVAGRIAPMVAVLVHNFDGRRERELSPLPVLEKYAVDELLPWVRATFGAGRKGRNIAAGVSLGGLAATYLGLRRPDEFGRVVAHSGSFWWPRTEPGRLLREVARAGRSPVRFYLDVGTCETRSVGPGVPNQIEFCRAMRDALLAHGHTVTYAEYSGGHDYLNWRRTFADGLLSTA